MDERDVVATFRWVTAIYLAPPTLYFILRYHIVRALRTGFWMKVADVPPAKLVETPQRRKTDRRINATL